MTTEEMNTLKAKEPRCLNAIVYRLVGIANGARKVERIMAEKPELIPNIDYYEALELCKSLSDDELAIIETANMKAQEAYNDVIDAMVGKKLLGLLKNL